MRFLGFKKAKQHLNWQLFLNVATVLGVGLVYLWHLGSKPAGLSPAETAAVKSSSSLQAIYNNPLNAPHKLVQYGLGQIPHDQHFFLRLTSVLFVFLFIFSFYKLTKGWFGRLTALLSTLLFATLPWTTLLGRSAAADIMLFAPVALITIYLWAIRAEKPLTVIYLILTLVAVATIYTPGGIWVVLAGAFLARHKLGETIKSLPGLTVLGGSLLLIALLAPIGLAATKNPDTLRPFLLLPQHWPGPLELTKSAIWSGLDLIWRTRLPNSLIIGRLPVFGLALIGLAIFGVYVLWTRARHEIYGLVALIVLGLAGTTLNNNLVFISPAILALAIFVAAGIRYLYGEWRSVFPLNPIPKSLAIAILVVLVSLQMLASLRYSLVAWPQTVATRTAYVIK